MWIGSKHLQSRITIISLLIPITHSKLSFEIGLFLFWVHYKSEYIPSCKILFSFQKLSTCPSIIFFLFFIKKTYAVWGAKTFEKKTYSNLSRKLQNWNNFKHFYAQELGVNYLLGKQVRSNARALSIFVNQFNATTLTGEPLTAS